MRLLLLLATTAVAFAQPAAPAAPRAKEFPDAELRKILAVLCPGQDYVTGDKNGCHVCPEGTMDEGRDAGGGGTVQNTIAGHLSGPKSEDVLLVMRGCEPHANGFVDSALFTKVDGQWTTGGMSPGAVGDCELISNNEGRQGLLCQRGDYHMGLMDASLRFGYVGGSDNDLINTYLMTAPCIGGEKSPTVANSSLVKREWTVAGGKRALNLTAECSRFRANCRARDEEPAGPVAKARTFHIQYIFDGESLVLSPASVAVKKAFDACAAVFEDPAPVKKPAVAKKAGAKP